MSIIGTNEQTFSGVNDKTSYEANNGTVKKKRVVTSTLHPLPHRSSSVDQHLKILKAYVEATEDGKKPVMYKDFKDMDLGFHHNYVSSNNKFLEELGLIESAATHGMYIPTKHALDFKRLTDWGETENALSILKELVKDSWFWNSSKKVLQMQEEGIEDTKILNRLGVDSKANPEKHMGSLKLLIEYLEYVGLVKRDEKTNKLKMVVDLIPNKSSSNPISNEDQITNAEITKPEEIHAVSSSLTSQSEQNTEHVHYREEPGHFTLQVKLEETSIQLLEEEIKYIKGKHALLQKLKVKDDK